MFPFDDSPDAGYATYRELRLGAPVSGGPTEPAGKHHQTVPSGFCRSGLLF
jgi:hypothetical protein